MTDWESCNPGRKTGWQYGATVEGAVFGIYNKDDIKAEGKVIVNADTPVTGNDF